MKRWILAAVYQLIIYFKMKHYLSAPLDFLNDFHGGKSSKRFWGNRTFTIAVLQGMFLFAAAIAIPVVSFFFMEVTRTLPDQTFNQCKDIIILFGGTGTILLGFGIFENFSKRR